MTWSLSPPPRAALSAGGWGQGQPFSGSQEPPRAGTASPGRSTWCRVSLGSAGLCDMQRLPTAGNGSGAAAAAAARGCGSGPGPVRPGPMEPFCLERDAKAKGLFLHASTTGLPIVPDPGQRRASNPCSSRCLDSSCPASHLPQRPRPSSAPHLPVPSTAGTSTLQAEWLWDAVVPPHSQRCMGAFKWNSGLC